MSLPHHIQQCNPVPQQSMQACQLDSPQRCPPAFQGSPTIPPVVSPYTPPGCPSFPGQPMGLPLPFPDFKLPSRVQPPCLPLPDPSSWSTTRTLPPPVNGLPASERFLPSALGSRMSTSRVSESVKESCLLPSSGPLGLSGARLEAEFPALGRSAQSTPAPVTPAPGATQTAPPRVLKSEPELKKTCFSGSFHDMKVYY